MSLIKVNYENNSVDARELYDDLFEGKEIKTAFNVWISRAIKKYGFKEEKDFQSFMIKSNGGRPSINYAVTLDMAKELAMVSPTEKGKITRAYFLKCEKTLHELTLKKQAVRLAGIETRKTLTDIIQESGENERMHGHAYSNFTKLAYKLTGLQDRYKGYQDKKGFRDTLNPEEIERVETIESIIRGLVKAGKQYNDIKDTLLPVFKELN